MLFKMNTGKGVGVSPLVLNPPVNRFRPDSSVIAKLGYTPIVMSSGQSLSIGTLNANYNTIPDQPHLPENFKAFVRTGSVGLERKVLDSTDLASLVRYYEGNGNGDKFYTHGTAFLKSTYNTDEVIWCNAGIGGEPIAALDKGGNQPAYENQRKYLTRAVELKPDARVDVITFFHGSSDTRSPMTTYYDKMVTYVANQQSLIKSVIPTNPDATFLFYQKGGPLSGATIQKAQLEYMKAHPTSKCVGGTYWLNRQHPNTETGVDGSTGSDRIHLNVKGYDYLGDMAAVAYKTEGYKPMHVTRVSLDNTKTLRLHVHNPFSGHLVIDTTERNMNTLSNYGFDIENGDNSLISPTQVTVEGNNVVCVFSEDIPYGSRLRIGFSSTDIGGDWDTPVGTGVDALTGTNIRGSYPHKSSMGHPDFYDWLCCDYIYLDQNVEGIAKPALGSELWTSAQNRRTRGRGQNYRWDGVNQTVNRDGSDEVTPTAGFVYGSSNAYVNFTIRSGRTYRLSLDVDITTAGAKVLIYVGGWSGAILTNANNGKYTADIKASGDHKLEIRLTDTAIVGSINNISLKEVLDVT